MNPPNQPCVSWPPQNRHQLKRITENICRFQAIGRKLPRLSAAVNLAQHCQETAKSFQGLLPKAARLKSSINLCKDLRCKVAAAGRMQMHGRVQRSRVLYAEQPGDVSPRTVCSHSARTKVIKKKKRSMTFDLAA